MMMRVNIFIGILFLITTKSIHGKDCWWPDKVCVPIHNCEAINRELYNNKLTDSATESLKKIQCGYRNGIVFVCCKSSLPKPKVCGPFEPKSRISHGKETDMDEYPWTALLVRKIDSKLRYECGGSLLNERYVLTSAHCVISEKLQRIRKLYEVRLGEWNKTNDDRDYIKSSFDNTTILADPVLHLGIEKYIVHEQYNGDKKKNDIALLKLDSKVKYTKYVRPICLPGPQESLIPVTKNSLYIMGWGKTEKKRTSDVKLAAAITYVPKSKCENMYRETVGYAFSGHFNKEHFCAGGITDTCSGDSGGPVVKFDYHNFVYYIVGIVTFGVNTCDNTLPGVYTNITVYLDWILQRIEH